MFFSVHSSHGGSLGQRDHWPLQDRLGPGPPPPDQLNSQDGVQTLLSTFQKCHFSTFSDVQGNTSMNPFDMYN